MNLVVAAVFAAEIAIVALGVLLWQWAGHVRTIREGRLRWTGTTIKIDNSSRTMNVAAVDPQAIAERVHLVETAEYWRAAAEAASSERDAARRLLALRHRTDLAVDRARAERPVDLSQEITLEMRRPVPPMPGPVSTGRVVSLEEWRPVRRTPPPLPPLSDRHRRLQILEPAR